jgi:hypothetical protein
MRTLAPAFAAFLLVAPQIAAAAEPPCLSPREATAVMAYALPGAISGTTRRCGPVLGKESWIARNGDDLARRYGERKTVLWPEAKAALLKVTAGSADPTLDMLKSLPDESLQQLTDAIVTGTVAEKIPDKRCFVVDRLLSLVAPLPPENTAELIALTLGVVSHGDSPKLGKLAICKAG